jgi:DNA-binding XRE family transcriptional regulator
MDPSDVIGRNLPSGPQSAFERELLDDPEIRFGYENYDLLQALGTAVREMRTEAGMTQVQLHAVSGVQQADISRIEKATMERGPSLTTLVRIARATGHQITLSVRKMDEPDAVERRLLDL